MVKEKLLFMTRADSSCDDMGSFDALVESGAKVIEFTLTIQDYHIAIKRAKEMIVGDMLVGTRTALD